MFQYTRWLHRRRVDILVKAVCSALYFLSAVKIATGVYDPSSCDTSSTCNSAKICRTTWHQGFNTWKDIYQMTCKSIQARALMASNLTTNPPNPHPRAASPAVDALEELSNADTRSMEDSSPHMSSTLTADLTNTVPAIDSGSSQNNAILTSTPMAAGHKSRVSPNPRDAFEMESGTRETVLSPNQSAIRENSVLDLKTGKVSGSSSQTDSPQTFHSVTPDGPSEAGVGEGDFLASQNSGTQTEGANLHEVLKVPILGYEVMEERSRFTIFKVQVRKSDFESWFIFRRYTDFVRLNDKLRQLFPHFRLALPPKRWFGDNFDRTFLDDRLLGLQAFLNNVAGHKDVVHSHPVASFFCLDHPPGPHDSLEESRALCESLEEVNYSLQKELEEKNTRISLLQEELSLQRKEIDNLKRALKLGRVERRRGSQQSELSITDTSALTEADQQRYANTDWSEVPVTRRSPVKERLYADNRLSLSNLSVGSMDIVPEEDRHSSSSVNIEATDAQCSPDFGVKNAASSSTGKRPGSMIDTRAQAKIDFQLNLNSDSKSMTSSQSGDSIMILDHELGASKAENRTVKAPIEMPIETDSVASTKVRERSSSLKDQNLGSNEKIANGIGS